MISGINWLFIVRLFLTEKSETISRERKLHSVTTSGFRNISLLANKTTDSIETFTAQTCVYSATFVDVNTISVEISFKPSTAFAITSIACFGADGFGDIVRAVYPTLAANGGVVWVVLAVRRLRLQCCL